MTRGKHPARSKTNWLGLVLILIAALELAQQYLPVILMDLAPKANAWLMLGVGVVVIVLRFLTSSPVSFRAPLRRPAPDDYDDYD